MGGEETLIAEPPSFELRGWHPVVDCSIFPSLTCSTPHTHTIMFTPPTYAQDCAEEHGCGRRSQLQTQHADLAICVSTPMSSLGTEAAEEKDIENYLMFN